MTGTRTIEFTLNGRDVRAQIEPHQTLIELLQERFALFGARESCGQGLCGCCTVKVDGEAVSGCLCLASFVDGARVETIEGMARGDRLNPIQEAFIEAGALQCGFCTSGFILMTQRLLEEIPEPDTDQIKDYLSGNLCRCGTYPEVIEAVKLASRKLRAGNAAAA